MSGLAAETVAALLEVGELVTLRRPGASPAQVSCTARIMDYAPQEIGAGVLQGDRKLVMADQEIAAAGFPGPPRQGDQILFRGRSATVRGCDTLTLGAVVIRHNIQIRGG